jgi:hypothetical protein
VRRYGHETRARGRGGRVDPRHCLHRIGVQHRARRALLDDVRDTIQRLDSADLVVDEHHRDDDGGLVEGVSERVEIDEAAPRRGNPVHPEPLVLEAVAGGEDRLVFESTGHDAVAEAGGSRRPTGSLDPEIVGLGAAGGEDHLTRLCAERPGHDLAGLLERRLRGSGGPVGS